MMEEEVVNCTCLSGDGMYVLLYVLEWTVFYFYSYTV